MVQHLNHQDIETVLDKIREKLNYKMNNEQLTDLELLDKEDAIILEFKTKKTVAEKKSLLNDLAGSGLQHGSDVIDDAVEVASREEEEDREGLNFG